MTFSKHDQPTTYLPSFDVPAHGDRRWTPLVLALSLVLLFLFLVMGGFALYYQDRVLPGVRVVGLDLGGQKQRDAAEQVSARVTSFATTPLKLEAGEQAWEIAPRDLGVVYDVPATMRQAMSIGRQGPLPERLAAWWPFGAQRHELQLIGHLDQGLLLNGLAPALPTLNRPALDALIVLEPENGLSLSNAVAGQQLDLAATTRALQERARSLSPRPVPLALLPVSPVVTEHDLAPVQDAADALLRQPLVLHAAAAPGSTHASNWEIAPEELAQMLTVTGPDHRALALEETRLAAVLTNVAGDVDRPSRNARLQFDAAGKPVIEPHEEGLAVDIPATVHAINQAIAGGSYRASVVVQTEQAAVLTADLEPVRVSAEQLVNRSLTLTAADTSRTLGQKEVASLLTIEERPAMDIKAAVVANRPVVADYLENFARQVDREARPPVFKYLGGSVTQAAEPVQGRELQADAALSALGDALVNPGQSRVDLPYKLIEAPLATVKPEEIVIRDVLGHGSTFYGFSLPDRKHNVELATQRLNGTLVPPGEIFSFNRSAGDVSLASGYRTGYGIILTNGAVQTVPSVGGGICQVATTVFHAAFHAGVTIGERNWHLYWIPTYGQAPSGLTGLDATVDQDYGLDFTFRNTTNNWLAVETSYDGQNMHITLKGIHPGWTVAVEGPAITNVKAHDPTPVFRDDPSLRRGERVQVESARDGMDVAITRRVVKDGQGVDQRTFTSHYQPSQNVTLVGTGG